VVMRNRPAVAAAVRIKAAIMAGSEVAQAAALRISVLRSGHLNKKNKRTVS